LTGSANLRNHYIKVTKIILWVYIILCFVIAGLNNGYKSRASADVVQIISWVWHFYENYVKTAFILICGFLTIKIAGGSAKMRKKNLIGFFASALCVHIIAPIVTKNSELYLFAMPLPWSTTPLQLMYPESSIYLTRHPLWGTFGITCALIFYVIMTAIVLIGTLLFGRRWQCSTLCLFNGFAAEVFDFAIPLAGKKKKVTKSGKKIFAVIKWAIFALSAFLSLWWVLFLSGIPVFDISKAAGKIELVKYLFFELFVSMFFWIFFIGRGYCYYCPLGTFLGFISKLSGQRIKTNNTKCVSCLRCNNTCPMSIKIMEKAQKGEDVADLLCVGCGHCIDACPSKTLSYSTRFLDKIKNAKKTYPDPAKSLEKVEK